MTDTVQPVSQILADSKFSAIAPFIRDEQYKLRDLRALRRRSLIWAALGLAIGVLGVIGAVVSLLFAGSGSEDVLISAMIFLIACYLLFLWLLSAFVRMRAVMGHFPELAAYDYRRPIAYLRNFAAENPSVSNPNMPIKMSFEHLLGTAFWSYGRVVALGDPVQRRPTGNVSRLFVTDAGWREAVLGMMEQARAIIIDYTAGANVDWEVNQSERFANTPRLIIMTIDRTTAQKRVADLHAPVALQATFANSKTRLPSADKLILGVIRGSKGETVFAQKADAVGFNKIVNVFKRSLGKKAREKLPAPVEALRAKLHNWTYLPTYCALPGLIAITSIVAAAGLAPGIWD